MNHESESKMHVIVNDEKLNDTVTHRRRLPDEVVNDEPFLLGLVHLFVDEWIPDSYLDLQLPTNSLPTFHQLSNKQISFKQISHKELLIHP